MTKQSPQQQAATRHDKLYLNTTPLWTEEMAHRLQVCRMKALWTQADLAKRLDISQQTLSRLEMGHIRTSTFSCMKLETLFGGAGFSYIVMGSQADKFDERLIGRKFNEVQRAKSNKWKKFPEGRKPAGIPSRSVLFSHESAKKDQAK